jgi:Leucine-rich repeat (LRR) protein
MKPWFILPLIGLIIACGNSQRPAPVKALKISQENAAVLDHLQDYPDLDTLTISCLEGLRALPDSIGNLSKLKALIVDNGNGCVMNPVLPESLGNLRGLEKLVLYGAQDPRAEGSDHPPQPTDRHPFPASMAQLKNLRYLDLGRNGFDQVPSFVTKLTNLTELRLQANMTLKALPPSIVELRELTTLKLDGNAFTDLPDFLTALAKLTTVSLGDNCVITQSAAKKSGLKARFPKVQFDFTDEFDCPEP